MFKRLLLIAVAFTLPGAAWAGAPAPAAESGSSGPVELFNAMDEAADRAQALFGPDESCPRNLDSAPIVVPVLSDDRLTGYAFVVPRICLKQSVRFDHLSNVHLLTDRFLRAAHRAPFVLDGDGAVSRDATTQAMLEAVGEFIEPGQIDRMDLLGEDIRYLR